MAKFLGDAKTVSILSSQIAIMLIAIKGAVDMDFLMGMIHYNKEKDLVIAIEIQKNVQKQNKAKILFPADLPVYIRDAANTRFGSYSIKRDKISKKVRTGLIGLSATMAFGISSSIDPKEIPPVIRERIIDTANVAHEFFTNKPLVTNKVK